MVVLYWLLVAVMGAGIIGAFIPAIPGPTVILAAIAVWGLVIGNFSSIAWALGAAIAVLLFSMGVDFLAGYWGAKQAGASHWGQIGAVVGMLLGLLGLLPALPVGGPLLGLFLGPLLGAIVGEFLYCKRFKRSLKAGLGIIVGSLVGNLVQGILAVIPVVVFISTTIQTVS
jgi:uncharacterized protein YqgC (DUF456 family)